MLVQLKKLEIINEGYGKTSINLNKVFINPSHIISVVDYDGVTEFLLNEGKVEYQNDKYSLLRLSVANKIEEMIVLGTSEEVFTRLQKPSGKSLLNE